jgi:hypothetical protein
VFTPIQGYEQAADLAELFARPLVRRLRLEGITPPRSTGSLPPKGARPSFGAALQEVH